MTDKQEKKHMIEIEWSAMLEMDFGATVNKFKDIGDKSFVRQLNS